MVCHDELCILLSLIHIYKKLAEIYYLKNDFSKAADAYSRFAMGPTANEEDLVKYAFALLDVYKRQR